jgi:hypothetical protein
VSAANEKLARLFGPDLIEILGQFVRDQVEKTLSQREAGPRWMTPHLRGTWIPRIRGISFAPTSRARRGGHRAMAA